MDEQVKGMGGTLRKAQDEEDTDAVWKIWSRLELTEEAAKKTRGRGKVMLTVQKPKVQDKKKDTTRDKRSIEARRCLKQARRSEQVAYRLAMLEKSMNNGMGIRRKWVLNLRRLIGSRRK